MINLTETELQFGVAVVVVSHHIIQDLCLKQGSVQDAFHEGMQILFPKTTVQSTKVQPIAAELMLMYLLAKLNREFGFRL